MSASTTANIYPDLICLLCGVQLEHREKSVASYLQKDKQWQNHMKSRPKNGSIMVPSKEVEAMHIFELPQLSSNFYRAGMTPPQI